MNCFPRQPVVIVLDIFFSPVIYNVATICEQCEQMLGIPVLCIDFIAPLWHLPSSERLQGLQLCSDKLADWPDSFFFLLLILKESMV